MTQYFKFDSNGYYISPIFADYNNDNPKPDDVTDIQPGNGLYKAKFDGVKWIETIDQATLVQEAISSKLDEINTKCDEVISDGVDVATSIGVKHFSLLAVDQMNLSGLSSELEKAIDGKPSKIDLTKGVPYHADGELCRFWSPDDFGAIMKITTDFIIYNNTYCNHLRVYIKRTTDLNTVNSMYYSIALPDDLQQNLNNILGIK